jgi:hypothetical protein
MFQIPKIVRVALAAALLCVAWTAQATTYKVGTGTGCSAATVQAAVDLAIHRSTPSDIYIATNQTYSNQAINVTAVPGVTVGINFIGGVPDCKTLQPSGSTSLNGGSGGSVITVRGAMSVKLSHLALSGGHGGSGGGLDYAGTGTVTIDNSTISDNSAGNGGGMRVQGNGGAVTMAINTNTLIIDNTASGSGGGLSLEGPVTMTMDAASTWIATNHAVNGFGGGISLVNGATANIGSPGYLFGGAIYDNDALNGGGIGIRGGGVRLYTTDPKHPITVDNNTAYQDGGGVYIVSTDSFVSELCAANFRITNNIAKEGTAVLTDDDDIGFGASVGFNVQTDFDPDRNCNFATHGNVACDASQQCNIVHGNVAMDVRNGNALTNGAALLINYASTLDALNLDVRDNTGGYALRELGNNSESGGNGVPTAVHLTNCLFADNIVSAELVLASGSGPSTLNLQNCTFAHDAIGASRVIAANDALAFNDNLIDEGSQIDALSFTGNASKLTAKYNIATDVTGLSLNTFNKQGQPTFIDAAHGDYRLFQGVLNGQLTTSLGIDYAPAVAGSDLDIRGQLRDQTVASPFYGPRDVGAYEMQGVDISDRIFIATFGDSILFVY